MGEPRLPRRRCVYRRWGADRSPVDPNTCMGDLDLLINTLNQLVRDKLIKPACEHPAKPSPISWYRTTKSKLTDADMAGLPSSAVLACQASARSPRALQLRCGIVPRSSFRTVSRTGPFQTTASMRSRYNLNIKHIVGFQL